MHIIVSGMVQGVFFRAFVKKNADMLGIKGWVKNIYENQVEIVAEGKEEQLEKLVSKARKGSPASRVEKIDIKQEPAKGGFKGFDIVY